MIVFSSKQSIGKEGEERACQYLKSIGYKIIQKNLKNKIGEIDIVAQDGKLFVLVEVKAGKTGQFGIAIERVGKFKQHKLKQLALKFWQDHPESHIRIDLINVDGQEITHIQNAIEIN